MLKAVGTVLQLAQRVLLDLHSSKFGIAVVVGLFTMAACTQGSTASPVSPTSTATLTPLPTTGPTPTLTAPSPVPPTQTPVPPTESPTSAPALAFPDLSIVTDAIGYAIAPAQLPDNFEFAGANLTRRVARLTYVNANKRLIIAYPVAFSKEESPFMKEIGLFRPDDALVPVTINGQSANLMRGGWSDDTIRQGPSVNPATAEWDYEKSLTIFFDYALTDGGNTGVAVQALVRPLEWTTADQMITIAESMVQAN